MVPPSVAAAIASSQFKSLQASTAMSASTRPSYPVLQDPSGGVGFDVQEFSDLGEANEAIRSLLKQTPFYLLPSNSTTTQQTTNKDGVERYSDRYERRARKDKLTAIPSPHHLFPDELLNTSTSNTMQSKQFSFHSAMAKLQQAERDDQKAIGDNGKDEDEEEDEKKEDEDELPDEQVYEEEELEDETDYNVSYFDNGEDYDEGGAGEDGEPSY